MIQQTLRTRNLMFCNIKRLHRKEALEPDLSRIITHRIGNDSSFDVSCKRFSFNEIFRMVDVKK